MRRLIIFIVAVGAGACIARTASAEDETAPVISLPWQKLCLSSEEPGKQRCFIGQKASIGCDRPLASIALYEENDAPHKRLSIILRRKVAMERGASIVIDQGTPMLTGRFLYCGVDGCVAEYEAGPDLLSQLKNGRLLVIEATDSINQPFRVAFSLAGFADAYEMPPQRAELKESVARAQWQQLLRGVENQRTDGAGTARQCPAKLPD